MYGDSLNVDELRLRIDHLTKRHKSLRHDIELYLVDYRFLEQSSQNIKDPVDRLNALSDVDAIGVNIGSLQRDEIRLMKELKQLRGQLAEAKRQECNGLVELIYASREEGDYEPSQQSGADGRAAAVDCRSEGTP